MTAGLLGYIGLIAVLVGSANAEQARFHVSAAGDDKNPGTESQPFGTIQKAVDSAQPGDLVYVRAAGGPFFLERRVVVNNKGGEPGKPIRLFAYPGEAPVIDGSRIPEAGSDVMRLNNASWWHLRGLTLVQGPEAGLFLNDDCHDNLIERCTAAHNGRLSEHEGSGFVLWGPTVRTMAANHFLNCDAHHNANLKGPVPFENGDGFKLNVGGPGNLMTGCRAWHNGDDGYDFFYATQPIGLRQCWATRNGVDDAQGTFTGKPAGKLGDGNGFKLGGDNSKGDTGGHTLIQCVAWGNPGTGFDENRGRKGVTLDQCTAWANGHHNFGFWNGGTPQHIFRNNIAAGPTPHNEAQGDRKNNTWNLGIEDPLFASTDDTSALGPRAEDGSLPKSDFLHLLPSSPCRGSGIGGVNIGAFPVARPVNE